MDKLALMGKTLINFSLPLYFGSLGRKQVLKPTQYQACKTLIGPQGTIHDCVTISIATQQRRAAVQHLLRYLSII